MRDGGPRALHRACGRFAFEVSFSSAILVSFVVTYVLIPEELNAGRVPTNFFFHVEDQMMHNCNVGFMAFELLFNGLPFYVRHLPIGVLWGILYVCFSWAVVRRGARAVSTCPCQLVAEIVASSWRRSWQAVPGYLPACPCPRPRTHRVCPCTVPCRTCCLGVACRRECAPTRGSRRARHGGPR